MPSFLDRVVFTASSGSTGSFVQSAAVTGFQTMQSGNAVDGRVYRYAAQSTDLTQWEVSFGTWTAGTQTLSRSTSPLYSSTSANGVVNFTNPPQVMITMVVEDWLQTSFLQANFGGL